MTENKQLWTLRKVSSLPRVFIIELLQYQRFATIDQDLPLVHGGNALSRLDNLFGAFRSFHWTLPAPTING